jgi:hypothetical protein
MLYTEVDRLLDPTPLPVETGYERLPDGVLHVACRTDLHGCTGEMFEWWFRSRPDTQRYVWWHPVDHVYSTWEGGTPDTHVGSTHIVEEYFTGLPKEQALIQFRDATESFNPDAYRAARVESRISAAVCARIGLSWESPRLPDGRILGGRLQGPSALVGSRPNKPRLQSQSRSVRPRHGRTSQRSSKQTGPWCPCRIRRADRRIPAD